MNKTCKAVSSSYSTSLSEEHSVDISDHLEVSPCGSPNSSLSPSSPDKLGLLRSESPTEGMGQFHKVYMGIKRQNLDLFNGTHNLLGSILKYSYSRFPCAYSPDTFQSTIKEVLNGFNGATSWKITLTFIKTI